MNGIDCQAMQCVDCVCYCYGNDQFHRRFRPSTNPPFEFKECGQLFRLEYDQVDHSVLDDSQSFFTSIDNPFPQTCEYPISFWFLPETEVSALRMAQTSHYYYSGTSKMDVSKNEDAWSNTHLIPSTPEKFTFSTEAKLWALRFGVMTVFTDPNLIMEHGANPQGVEQNSTDHSNPIRELIYSITRVPN